MAEKSRSISELGASRDREYSMQKEKNRGALEIIERSLFLKPLLYVQDAELYEEDPESEGYIQGRYVGKGEERYFEAGNGDEHTDFLENTSITDIGFDGYNLYVVDNNIGHYRVNDPEKDPRKIAGLPKIKCTTRDIDNLARDVANKMSEEYNTSNPIFDVELGYLRTNFVAESVAPYGNTMALRVSRPSLAIKELSSMATEEVDKLIEVLMRTKTNILISGATGSGKTEFQKRMIGYVPNNQKITLMEDTMDSHIKEIYPEKDINSWVTNVVTGTNEMNRMNIDFLELLRAALRNFPDWAIVSEVRGAEAGALLSVALSGHAVVTTLHTRGAASIPERMADMVSMGDSKMDYGALLRNILSVFKIGIHLERDTDPETGATIRYVREIYEYVDYDEELGIIGYPLYKRSQEYDTYKKEYRVNKHHYRMSDELIQDITNLREIDKLPDVFKQGVYAHETLESKRNR